MLWLPYESALDGVNHQTAASVVLVLPSCVPSAYTVTVVPVGVLAAAAPLIAGRLLWSV